jgi:hypothetical protein
LKTHPHYRAMKRRAARKRQTITQQQAHTH